MQNVPHAKWTKSLTFILTPLLPLDILAETVDYLASVIVDADITIPESHSTLSLEELDELALTSILAVELTPLIDAESWGLLTSDLLDHLAQPDEEETEVERKGDCELCHREMPITLHHLVPRSTHDYFLAHPDQLGFEVTKMSLRMKTVRLCRPCHTHVHSTIRDHRTLAREYGSIETLMSLESIRKFVAYISKQRTSDGRMATIRYRR